MTIEGKEKKKVFISYVHENRDQVDKISEVFAKKKIDYWIDREQIEPGKLWKKAINEAINKGAYFLACFSKEYENKLETHMNEEILLAIDILKKKQLNSGWFIPVKLNECKIPDYDIGASRTLRDIHYLDFTKEWDQNIIRLIAIIKPEIRENQNHDHYFENEYKKKKFLIVPSEKTQGKVMMTNLKRLGCSHIHIAENGISALNYIEREKVEFIILFDWLADMYGVELIEKLRGLEYFTNLPILLMTPNFIPKKLIDSELSNDQDFLMIPCTIYELEKKIKAMLNK